MADWRKVQARRLLKKDIIKATLYVAISAASLLTLALALTIVEKS